VTDPDSAADPSGDLPVMLPPPFGASTPAPPEPEPPADVPADDPDIP
jgi:hypothetical protein